MPIKRGKFLLNIGHHHHPNPNPIQKTSVSTSSSKQSIIKGQYTLNIPRTIPKMPRVDFTHYELWLAQCKITTPTEFVHWMLLMVHPGDNRCFWCHSVNESGQERDYDMLIEPNRRFDSWSFHDKFFLGIFPTELGRVVSQEAYKVPPQNCQYWALYVILRLERRGLLSEGLYREWIGQVSECWGDEGPGDLRY
jgi:hypothetical protein